MSAKKKIILSIVSACVLVAFTITAVWQFNKNALNVSSKFQSNSHVDSMETESTNNNSNTNNDDNSDTIDVWDDYADTENNGDTNNQHVNHNYYSNKDNDNKDNDNKDNDNKDNDNKDNDNKDNDNKDNDNKDNDNKDNDNKDNDNNNNDNKDTDKANDKIIKPIYKSVTYIENDKNFPNPERGWHVPIDPNGQTNSTADPITLEQIKKWRAKGITLIRKYYILNQCREEDIPQDFLQNQIVSDLEMCRLGGIKIIPRIAYTWIVAKDGGEDASVEWVERHFEQLSPVFHEYYDVIDHVQSGVVGYYGEWHDSTNGNVNNSDLTLNDNSKAILKAILKNVPANRMVSMRYPKQKIQLWSKPLTRQNAYISSPGIGLFDGLDPSRLSYFNDGWLYDGSDFGTFEGDDLELQAAQKEYQDADTKYVIMAGEPGGVNGNSYALRTDPFVDLENTNWTTLSNNQGDASSGGLYAYWQDLGIYDDIGRRLGYRYSFTSSKMPNAVKPGDILHVSLGIKNSGFATLHNERTVELILRNTSTQKEYMVKLNDDPRFWMDGTVSTIDIKAKLPENIQKGTYEVFLNLPDEAETLYGRSEFSIRFANNNVWENSTGYNQLKGIIKINNNVQENGIEYKGQQCFVPKTSVHYTSVPEITLNNSSNNFAKPASQTDSNDVAATFEIGNTNTSFNGLKITDEEWQVLSDSDEDFYIVPNHSTVTIRIPQGMTLKSFNMKKLNEGDHDEIITITSNSGEVFSWKNMPYWWNKFETNFKQTSSTLTIKVSSTEGASCIALDDFIFTPPETHEINIDFSDISVENGKYVLLNGIYKNIDFGEGVWQVGSISAWDAEAGKDIDKKFLSLVSTNTQQNTGSFLPPDDYFLESVRARKLKGLGDDGAGGVEMVLSGTDVRIGASWIPTGWFHGPYSSYGGIGACASGTLSLTVNDLNGFTSQYGPSNIMLTDITFIAPLQSEPVNPDDYIYDDMFTACIEIKCDGELNNVETVELENDNLKRSMKLNDIGKYSTQVPTGAYNIVVNGKDTGLTIEGTDGLCEQTVEYYTVKYHSHATGIQSGGEITAMAGTKKIANSEWVLSGTSVLFTVETNEGDTVQWGGGVQGNTESVSVVYGKMIPTVFCKITPMDPLAMYITITNNVLYADTPTTLTATVKNDVDNVGVTWQIVPEGTGKASISDNVITVTRVGTITVKAISVADKDVVKQKTFTVTFNPEKNYLVNGDFSDGTVNHWFADGAGSWGGTPSIVENYQEKSNLITSLEKPAYLKSDEIIVPYGAKSVKLSFWAKKTTGEMKFGMDVDGEVAEPYFVSTWDTYDGVVTEVWLNIPQPVTRNGKFQLKIDLSQNCIIDDIGTFFSETTVK